MFDYEDYILSNININGIKYNPSKQSLVYHEHNVSLEITNYEIKVVPRKVCENTYRMSKKEKP